MEKKRIKTTMDIKGLGNIYNPSFKGTNYAGYVYDANYIAPCLTGMTGGGRQPMVIVKTQKVNETTLS